MRNQSRANGSLHYLKPKLGHSLKLKVFPGISGTVYLYLNYSEFFSLFMTLVQWHLSCSVVFLWSVDTISLGKPELVSRVIPQLGLAGELPLVESPG